MKSLLEKRSVVMEQQSSEKQRTSTITHQFNVYLKLLFGQDLNLQDELLLSNQWGKFNQKKVQAPQGVLCFPNPDHKSQKIKYVKPFEFLRFLDKCILGQNNQQKQLFIYCIYQVFKNLEAGEDPQNEKSSFQSFVNQDTINDSQDVIQDMTEQFKQNIRKIKKSKYCDYLKLNIEELISLDDKKMNYGKQYQLIHKQWQRSGKVCSDYLTLIRNIVLIILAKNGFHTDLFFSEDGAQIYCLLELDENNLTKVASKHNIMKQINISFFDLFSFEPVDKNLRSLRLNNRLWKLEEYKVSETLNYLRPKIIELLDEINFKQLAREVNQAGINQQQFQYGKVDLENDYVGPTDNEWVAYYHWLVNINKLIQLIREDYRLDNDAASLLQNQVQPFQLFLARYRQQYPHITKLNIKQEQNQKIYQIFQDFKNQHLYLLEFYKQFSIFSGLPINKQIKLIKKEELATGYLKAFKDSMTIANHQQKFLFNIWDRLNIKPFTPFLGFQFSYKTLQFQLTRQINFWQKYQINEQNQISLFSTSERLKLLQLALNQILNVNDLLDMGYAKLFCIHDYYELYGNCNNYYEQIKESSNFYEKKIFAIRQKWKFNSLWVIPQDMINQYFGQKVGLYFYYLSYFTFMMFPISIFGFILSILQWTVDDSKEILTFVFSIIQMQWTNLLDDMWEEKQRIFNLREGQSDKHQKSSPRGNYVGSFGRSIESDNLNVFVSNSRLFNFSLLSLVISKYVKNYCTQLLNSEYEAVLKFRKLFLISQEQPKT